MAVCASGNYGVGAIWPPLTQYGVESVGWRSTYVALGLFCGIGMVLHSLLMRQRPPLLHTPVVGSAQALQSQRPLGSCPNNAQFFNDRPLTSSRRGPGGKSGDAVF